MALPPVLWQGELVVDGGVFNNLPTDVMAKMGARKIIGVDLTRRAPRRYDFDEVPGTRELLLDRFRLRSKQRYRLPSLGTMLMGITILYSESRREHAKRSVDIYLNPELGRRRPRRLEGVRQDRRVGLQPRKECPRVNARVGAGGVPKRVAQFGC